MLKKSRRRGTTGSYSLTGGYGKGEKLTGNVGLTHNTPKSFFNGSYTFSRNHTYSDMFITSSQNMPALGGELFATLQDTTWHRQDNHNLSLGYDYKPDSTITISTSLDVNKSNTSSTNRTYGSYKIAPDSVLFFTGDIAGKNRWTNLNGSVALEKRFKPEEKLTMEADYLFYDNNNPTDVQNSFTNKNGDRAGTNDDTLFSPLQKGFAKTTINVGVIKLDYEKQLSQKLRVEAGIKATNTRSSSLSGINSVINGNWTGRNETSNNILMKENLGAFYASVTTRFNAATTLVTGARYEYAHTSLDNLGSMAPPVVRRRGVIFPSLFFTKKITDQNELQLSYTKRISRPSYNDLASYVIYSDPAAVYTGNPYLQPTITHNIKVGWQSESFNFSLLLSRDFHPIARYQITQKPAANLLYISPQNLDWQNNITFQSNIPWRLNAWWMSNYGFTGGLRSFRVLHTLQPVEKTYFGYSANFSQAFTLPERFLLELSGWYNSFSYNGSIKVAGSFMLNLGIKKELKNERGIFQLAISDLLKTARINTYYGTIAKEAFDIKNHVSINTESQKFPIIKLTYSRSFGGGIMKAPRSNPGNNSEERERIRKD